MFEGKIVYDGPTEELTEPVIEKIYGKPMAELMIGGEYPEVNP
jgi:ABC-type phosphate/phosphonate transport system ATPase subunit